MKYKQWAIFSAILIFFIGVLLLVFYPYKVRAVGRASSASPVISTVVKHGQSREVSTIFGNGTTGQSRLSMDHPRGVDIDSKRNVYFIDGDQKHAKLRKTNGWTNTLVVDLVQAKITKQRGYFNAAGLAIIKDRIYVASDEDVYKVEGGKILSLDPQIKRYLNVNGYDYIFRIRKYKDHLYLMLHKKNHTWSFISYQPSTRQLEVVLEDCNYANPYNFYIDDRGILVGTGFGEIFYENFFPRRSMTVLETNTGMISDVWFYKDEVYYAEWEDRTRAKIYMIPKNTVDGEPVFIAGGRRGFVDGLESEVEMDQPTDFVWDGSGFIFADMGNGAIRKLWMK